MENVCVRVCVCRDVGGGWRKEVRKENIALTFMVTTTNNPGRCSVSIPINKTIFVVLGVYVRVIYFVSFQNKENVVRFMTGGS